jgi:hypothetical protein
VDSSVLHGASLCIPVVETGTIRDSFVYSDDIPQCVSYMHLQLKTLSWITIVLMLLHYSIWSSFLTIAQILRTMSPLKPLPIQPY